MRALVVEDEVTLANNIAQALREGAGFAVDISNDGLEGLHFATTNPYDLVVLDLMLPGMNGMDILKNIRDKGIKTAVLIMTARDTSEDIINGLNVGADDYLTKPFDVGEFIARCKALVRRSYSEPSPEITISGIRINTLKKQVFVSDKPVTLTALEYKTLEYFFMRCNEIVTKTDLLEHLYDQDWDRDSNVIEVHISSLRKKLDPNKTLNPIKTMRGYGYIIER